MCINSNEVLLIVMYMIKTDSTDLNYLQSSKYIANQTNISNRP